MKYKILHDSNLPLCFIGDTYNNNTLFDYFKDTRPCEKFLIEEIKNKDKHWFAARQFMSCGTGQAFKKQIVNSLEEFNLNWFSVISANTHLGHDVQIGHNTFINNFNVILDKTIIGNHCVITAFVCISHSVNIGDFCHISPYSYLCFTRLGAGVYIGTRSTFTGNEQNIINITDWCNFMLDSVVTGDITEAGTYYGKRKHSNETSLTLSI